MPDQSLIGMIVLFERRTTKRDSDRSGFFEIVVLGCAMHAVTKQNRRSNAAVINLLSAFDVKPDHGNVASRAGVRSDRVA